MRLKDDDGRTAAMDTSQNLMQCVWCALRRGGDTHVTQKAGKSTHSETQNAALMVLTELLGQMKQLREDNRQQAERVSLDEFRKATEDQTPAWKTRPGRRPEPVTMPGGRTITSSAVSWKS